MRLKKLPPQETQHQVDGNQAPPEAGVLLATLENTNLEIVEAVESILSDLCHSWEYTDYGDENEPDIAEMMFELRDDITDIDILLDRFEEMLDQICESYPRIELEIIFPYAPALVTVFEKD